MAGYRRTRRAWLDVLLSASFMGAVATPTIVWLSNGRAERAPMLENRMTARRPSLEPNLASLNAYPAQFAAWYGDTFGLRDVLLRWNNAFKLFAFGVSPTRMLVLGERDWLYAADEQGIAIRRGLAPLHTDEIEVWRRALAARRDWLARRGIEYVFAIVPNKEQVYPEHFPARFNQVGPTRLDQLASSLQDVPFLDLRQALIAERANDRVDDHVFHRLGTHWTARGAFAGCAAIIERLRATHPELVSAGRDEFESRPASGAAQDSMGVALYLPELLREPIHDFVRRMHPRSPAVRVEGITGPQCVTTETGDARLPRVVLIHDSFGPWLRPFLADHCSRLTSSPDTPGNTTLISRERPQIVIQMYTENALARPLFPWLLAGELIDHDEFDAAQPTDPPTRTAALVELHAEGPGLHVPPISIPPGARAALGLRIESPDPAALTIELAQDAQQAPEPASSCSILLAPGSNECAVLLPGTGAPGGWRLRADPSARPLLIHEFEIRLCRR